MIRKLGILGVVLAVVGVMAAPARAGHGPSTATVTDVVLLPGVYWVYTGEAVATPSPTGGSVIEATCQIATQAQLHVFTPEPQCYVRNLTTGAAHRLIAVPGAPVGVAAGAFTSPGQAFELCVGAVYYTPSSGMNRHEAPCVTLH